MTAIAAICGAGVGLGLILIIAGWRGVTFSKYFAPESHAVRAAIARSGINLTNIAAAVGAGLLIALVTGWPVAGILGGLFVFSAPKLFAGKASSVAMIERTEAVATWVEMLRDTMAGAAGIETAITATAQVAPAPIRPEVETLARRLGRQSLTQALGQFANELEHPTSDLVAAALSLASRHQAANLGDLLGSLAQAARDDATMRLRVEAGRARVRTSVRVVVIATVSMAAGLMVLNRNYLAPYDSAVGQLMLAVVGTCFAGAFWWMQRMSQVQAPARIFVRSDEVS